MFKRGAFRYENQSVDNSKEAERIEIDDRNLGSRTSSIFGFPVSSLRTNFASFQKTYWASDMLLMFPDAYQNRSIYGFSDLMKVLKGIPLKVETDYGSFKVTQEAVNISKQPPEDGLFVLPDRNPEPYLD